MNYIFFGTDSFSITTVEELVARGLCPRAIVTVPDKPVGRKHEMTPPPLKVWAEIKNFNVLQPEKLDADFIDSLKRYEPDFFVVASYGKIIPKEVLDMPSMGAFNIHPSLLPKYRGPSPLQQSILDDAKETGVTIIKMDEKMDHGPIVAQEDLNTDLLPHNWPPTSVELGTHLFNRGAELLHDLIVTNNITETEQDHDAATFTEFIKKSDSEINLSDDPYQNFLKYQAFHAWPRTFFMKDGKRNVITDAEFSNNEFVIKKIIPEGKTETTYVE